MDNPPKGRAIGWANLKPLKPGETRNPGGRPVGSRNALQGSFLRTLAADFDKHGKAAVVRCREETPAQYLKVIASLMPRELELRRPTDDLTDDDLANALSALRALVVAQSAGAGDGAAGQPAPALDVSTLQ